jgi:hypothetical protein
MLARRILLACLNDVGEIRVPSSGASKIANHLD